MKQIKYIGFEQGPMRPPSEAESLLLLITKNCSWNFCTFCSFYKGKKFSKRPVEHILKDIDRVHEYVEIILQNGKTNKRAGTEDFQALQAAHNFVAGGMKSVFFQDGNSLIMPPEDLIRILGHIRQAFPLVERITSYSRSDTIAKISDKNLAKIAEAGLNRVHIGMESGSDVVLEKVRKGSDKKTHIKAGQKVKRAGMELSEFYMPGLGGKSLSREHALETADALNQINPDFIRIRTLALADKAPLTQEYKDGNFDKIGEVDTARELLLFLQSLKGIDSTVTSDHILNLFHEVDGKLPDDQKKITAPVQEFLNLDAHSQMLYCVGRRTRQIPFLSLSPSAFHDPENRKYAEKVCTNLGVTTKNMDVMIDSIIKQYVSF